MIGAAIIMSRESEIQEHPRISRLEVMRIIGTILKGILGGRWKTAIFSITSACNCRCPTCNIPNLPDHFISLGAAFEVLHQCLRNKVILLSITGGEPLMHPHLPSLAKRAKEMGFIVHIATNGTLPDRIRDLRGFVDLIGFGIDSPIASEHDSNKDHRNALKKCRESVEGCKRLGINAFANTLPNKYIIDEVEEYVSVMNYEWGIPVGFCYPEVDNGGYFSIDENPVSTLSAEQIADFFRTALRLKRMGYEILNTDVFLREAVEYAKGNYDKVSRCRSGEVVYWVDWFGNVYPCFSKRDVLNKGADWERYNPDACNDCFTQCFREPSSAASNFLSLLKELRTFKSFI